MQRDISESIDYIIRKSIIGKNLSRLRKLSPGLYNYVRKLYSAVFKIESKNNLARYQIRSLRRFFEFVPPQLLAEPVLEIGSDVDAKVIREMYELGCPVVTGVNPVFTEEELDKYNPSLPPGCVLKSADMRYTGFDNESFGTIFSVSVFEHLLDFDRCLSEMHRILIPGGMVYADFGPIWSSSLGHHVFANFGTEQARHWDPRLNPLNNFAHLISTKEEMELFLSGKVSDGLRSAIVEWVYQSDDINRLFFEDYVNMIEASPFEVVFMEEDREYVPEDMLRQLKEQHNGYENFDVRNVELVLRKSD